MTVRSHIDNTSSKPWKSSISFERLQVSCSRFAHPFNPCRKISNIFRNMKSTMPFILALLLLANSSQAQPQFTYITNNGSITITGVSFPITLHGVSGPITIPSIINGLTVTTIGDTFPGEGSDFLTSVTIPNSVTVIEGNAFLDCANLTTVTIGTGLTSIGEYAFDGCLNLTALYFEGNAPYAGGVVFASDPVIAYYLPGTTGWINFPLPSEPWNLPSAPNITTPPVSQIVLAGATVSFSVTASGFPVPAYQWKHGGTKLLDSGEFSGTETPTLYINSAQAKDAGSYTVVISNSKGSSNASATLTVNMAQPLTTVYNFTGVSDGGTLQTPLMLAGSTFYGTTSGGGANGNGTVFAVNTNGTDFKTVYTFTGATNGAGPYDTLILLGNTLYGTAEKGGSSSNGTVFAVDIDGTDFTNLYDFSVTDTNGFNSDGANPAGLAISGNILFGTTIHGGSSGAGTVFTINIDGTDFSSLYSFTNGIDGSNPGGLNLSGSTLYGTAEGGGAAGAGTVFAVNTDGTGFTTLHSFDELVYDTAISISTNNDGAQPQMGFILSGNTIYGTCSLGGGAGEGTVFKINTDGRGFSNLYDFTGGSIFDIYVINSDGAFPNSGLILSSNILYGTTSQGGSLGLGTVFKINTDGTAFTPLTYFELTYDGGIVSDADLPGDGLILSGNTLYGTCYFGGSSGKGTVFSLPLVSGTATPGSLEVTITPAAAVNDGARWRVNGGAFQVSGATVTNLSPTNVTVSFKAIPGFATPSNQTVKITSGQPITLTDTYLDTNQPNLSIVSPKAGQNVSNASFIVTGTAGDNVAVAAVYYQLDAGSWTLANFTNGFTNWTANVTELTPGSNVISAYVVDTSGNSSPTNKVAFHYIPSATLTVRTNGFGSITPVDNGKLLAIGTNYILAASPGKNWLFSNWVGGTTIPYRVLSSSSNYTFPMQSNLVLQANFVTNPFLAVAGVYNGLFYPTNGVTEASSGFITVAIASNGTGAYTAKLLLDGGSNSFSGSFDLTGTAQTNLVRSGKTPVSVTLLLDFNPADALMGGSVSNAAAGWNSVIQADRAVFSATANPAVNYAGQFTLLLPPGTNAPVGSPDGYGYAAITNTLGGISTLGGALADGTPFLWSVPIARNGGVPLYQSLYSGKGSLLGWIYFTNQPPQDVSTNSSVSWIKPALANTLYPFGFTNLTGMLGSPYTNTARAGVPVLKLTSATLLLTNGDLTNGFLIYTNIGTNLSSHSTLTNLDAGNPHLSPTNYLVIAINTNNGLVTVTFQPTGAKMNTVAHGAVLQNQTDAAGYFLGTNQGGAFILGLPYK
jgi:uncharacterized repeat protein (TIGR03803 family)